MAEFQNLSKLLEAIKMTTDAHEKLKAAQERLDNAEADQMDAATEDFNKCSLELMKLKETEESYRKIARTYLVAEVTEIKKDEKPNEEKSRTGVKSTTSFKLPQLDKFKRGDNFSKFCEKFLEYVTLGNMGGDNLPLVFLQLVDDFTKEKLKKIALLLARVGMRSCSSMST